MRQTGFPAAAGLVALRDMLEQLRTDHENAVYLAGNLGALDGVEVARDRLAINMVFFTIYRPEALLRTLLERLQARNIYTCPRTTDGEWRWGTHYGVGQDDIDQAVETLKALM